ncbi:hypothetical protein BKA83DRAFT_4489155 [Pisolithus microcarpus]|nr:hypothetical protein BKA83DRAFT_4489155 [Pisolithus microcarpus]
MPSRIPENREYWDWSVDGACYLSAADMPYNEQTIITTAGKQKVTQVLKFFELEVTCAQEDKQAAEDVRVADQEAKADAKEAEEIMHKKVQKVGWKDIPTHLKEKPMTAVKLKELHEKKYIYIPWYTCPEVTCQTFVECKPMEVDAAKHMIGTVNAIFGAPAGQVNLALLLQHRNIWADVFYEDDNQ